MKPAPKDQIEMPFLEPSFHVPVIKLRQPDGSLLVKAGKPEMVDGDVTVAQFHKLTGISIRYIEMLCSEGRITHRRMSPKSRSKILIPQSEVARYKSLEGDI